MTGSPVASWMARTIAAARGGSHSSARAGAVLGHLLHRAAHVDVDDLRARTPSPISGRLRHRPPARRRRSAASTAAPPRRRGAGTAACAALARISPWRSPARWGRAPRPAGRRARGTASRSPRPWARGCRGSSVCRDRCGSMEGRTPSGEMHGAGRTRRPRRPVLGVEVHVLRFRLGSIPVVVHPATSCSLRSGRSGLSYVAGGPSEAAAPRHRGRCSSAGLGCPWSSSRSSSTSSGTRSPSGPSATASTVAAGLRSVACTTPNDRPAPPWGKDVVTTLAGPALRSLAGPRSASGCSPGPPAPSPRTRSPSARGRTSSGRRSTCSRSCPGRGPDQPVPSSAGCSALGGCSPAHVLGVLVCGVIAYLALPYRIRGPGHPRLRSCLFGGPELPGADGLVANRAGGARPRRSSSRREALFRAGELDRGAAARLRPARRRARGRHPLAHPPPARMDGAEGGRGPARAGPLLPGAGAARRAARAGRRLLPVGDDARAIPLWEQAARRDEGPHRAPRVGGRAPPPRGAARPLRRCPASTRPRPSSCAERVAFIRGAYSEAAPLRARSRWPAGRPRPGPTTPPAPTPGPATPGERWRSSSGRATSATGHEKLPPATPTSSPCRRAGVPGVAGVPREICGVLTEP